MRGFLGFGVAGAQREHPGKTADTNEEICLSDAHARTDTATITELTVLGDGRVFCQGLLIGRVFCFQPSHGVKLVRIGEDFWIAANGPFERMHNGASRDEITFVYVVFDRLVWDAGRDRRTPLKS